MVYESAVDGLCKERLESSKGEYVNLVRETDSGSLAARRDKVAYLPARRIIWGLITRIEIRGYVK